MLFQQLLSCTASELYIYNMIRWVTIKISSASAAKAAKRNGCSSISWRRFNDIDVFRVSPYFLAQMTVTNI
jgi:hypothetical protein